jgi:hypothetical protein
MATLLNVPLSGLTSTAQRTLQMTIQKTTRLDESEVWEAGRVAYRQGKCNRCPIRFTGVQADAWRKGWDFEKGQEPFRGRESE